MNLAIEFMGGGLIFLASVLLTGLIRHYAIGTQLLDHPNHRSSHTTPTPRGGGLAIVATFAVSVLLLRAQSLLSSAACWAMLGGGGLVAAVGWRDDCCHVAAVTRLAIHALAVGVGLFSLGWVPPLTVGGWEVPAGVPLNLSAGVGLVWLLNLFNFMDGIDGLAGMEASFVALGGAMLILLQGSDAGLEARMLFSLALSCLGFLAWNWPPAKIFMGDVGSGFLGYALGMTIVLTVQSNALTLPVWLILLASFGSDATLTLLSRMAKGERFWAAHRSHAYQYAARRYGSHQAVTLRVLAINCCWLLPLAFIANQHRELGWPLALMATVPLLVLVAQEKARRNDGNVPYAARDNG